MPPIYLRFLLLLMAILSIFLMCRHLTSKHESKLTETVPSPSKVKQLTNCLDKKAVPKIQQRGDYWILYNYVRPRKEFKCHESITYTTHGDFSFLDNLIPLLEKWKGPVSMALYAPGEDFKNTIDSILHLRECAGNLVKDFVTFHIYFHKDHFPSKIIGVQDIIDCNKTAPYLSFSSENMYKIKKKLSYPINVGRNVAREMAQTHFVLASDIELYPSVNLIPQFLEMIARNEGPLQSLKPKVFPLNIFEVKADKTVPETKHDLIKLIKSKDAIPFHKKMCPKCHSVPKGDQWMESENSGSLDVFTVGKRIGKFNHWEPIYIGTNNEPPYDERLSWEGKSDKMTQGFTLCVLDYEFLILNNAFLIHRPGIKVYKKNPERDKLAKEVRKYIAKTVIPELSTLFGSRKGCLA